MGETEHEGEGPGNPLCQPGGGHGVVPEEKSQEPPSFPAPSGLYVACAMLLEPVGSTSRRQHGIQGTVSNPVQLHSSQ